MSATTHLLTEIEASAHKWEPRLVGLNDAAADEWRHLESRTRSLLFYVRMVGVLSSEIRAGIEE